MHKIDQQFVEDSAAATKKISKRQDSNANKTYTESTPKILRKRTRNPNRNTGKYRRIVHLLARAEHNKRKSDFKTKKKDIARCLEERDSKAKKNWRKLNKRKNKKPGEKNGIPNNSVEKYR